MKYTLLPEALIEYSEAIQYYANQSRDLGQEFINVIEESIYRIREFPERWGTIGGGIRRCQVHKFPYSVLYAVKLDEEETHITIIAVMHGRRKPGYWNTRKF